MESHQLRRVLKLTLILALLGQGASDYKILCGEWDHGKSVNLGFTLRRGCKGIVMQANETTLFIGGRMTGNCEKSSTIPLDLGRGKSQYCVYWEPLLDFLQVEVGGRNHTLCKTAALQQSCCFIDTIGICIMMKVTGTNWYLSTTYSHSGQVEDCKTTPPFVFAEKDLCGEDSPQLIEELALRSGVIGPVDLPCAHVYTKKLEEGFQGLKVIFPAPEKKPLINGSRVSVWLPPSLVSSEDGGATVVFTYYKENTLFQSPQGRILDQVVGISVENRVIANLPDPVKIVFYHRPVAKTESTKCVFWDATKDTANVIWRDEGCNTISRNEETECHCDHLTYFTILLEQNPGKPVDDLEALTCITSVCCAISLCSCVVLIILLTKELGRANVVKSNKMSIHIHRNMAVAQLLLCLLFVLTGTLVDVVSEGVCLSMGAALHYALLCSFTWMAIEVVTASWLVHPEMDPKDFLSLCMLTTLGFGLPAVLVVVIVIINDVYGTRAITASDDVTSPYKMCWIKDNGTGTAIHYIFNLGFPLAVLFAGIFLRKRLKKAQTELGQSQSQTRGQVTFSYIWRFSCLFSFTCGLGLLQLGNLSRVASFLFCIINSLQGFLLLMWHFLVKRRRGEQQPPAEGDGDGMQLQVASQGRDRKQQQAASQGGDGEQQQAASQGGDRKQQQAASQGGDRKQQQAASQGGDRKQPQAASQGGDGEQQPKEGAEYISPQQTTVINMHSHGNVSLVMNQLNMRDHLGRNY